MSVKPTNIPTCHLRKSADSAGNFSRHCKLGEVTENIRTFALPFESKPYTFKMCFEYDSWNRMQRMTYPDGEKVSYGYNLGGMLYSIEGDKGGQAYMYVKHIAYNKYELKESVLYGNGSFTTYDYDNLMRLAHLQSFTGAAAEQMQDITYDYDAVSNITHIDNQAPALSYGIGGIYTNDYSYDNLYRLSSANGSWDNGAMTNSFDLAMSYHPNGRIAEKQLRADVLDHLGSITTKDYDNLYSYPSGRNTLEQVEDQTDGSPLNTFEWDHAGNMTSQRFHDECIRKMCWDEENRLMSVSDCNYASLYQYDATGERTYKLTGQYRYQNINGRYFPYAVLDNPTLYASPYVVCTPKGYTKHYYAESERVASKIGNGCLKDLCTAINTAADFNEKDILDNQYLIDCVNDNDSLKVKLEKNYLYGKKVLDCTDAGNFYVKNELEKLYQFVDCPDEKEKECYWYHPDHLGSSSWITEVGGKPIQHLHYLPWGEDFVDQRSTSWNAMHTFSAKERDTETGLSYFGARYYSSDLSIWLSVDPMSDKYPSLSPYTYCANNPVKLVDPNGEEVWLIGKEWELAFKQLKSATNLILERDAETGKITYSGTILTENDQKLADALDDKKVQINILAEDWDTFEGYTHNGGAHLGTNLKEDGTVVSKQFVNPLMLAGCDFYGNMEETTLPNGQTIKSPIPGKRKYTILHEITEAHMAGLISIDTHTNLHMAVPDDSTYGLYLKAHYRATPPPESTCLTPKSIRAFASLVRTLRNLHCK